VITPQEIAAVTEDYRRTAGFAAADRRKGTSRLDRPCAP